MTALAFAVGLDVVGVAAIFAGWRRLVEFRRLTIAGGWTAIVGAGVLWCRAAGAEFGVVYVCLFTTAAAWVAVGVNYELRAGRNQDRTSGALVVPDRAKLARHVLRFVVAVPLAAVASALIGVAAVRLLPWGRVDSMALVVLGIPFVWGLAAWWACADPDVRRPALGLAAAGLAGAALVFVG